MRPRKSAKEEIAKFAEELMARKMDPDREVKLNTVMAVAYRMGWTELYNRLRYRRKVENEEPEYIEPWWAR